MPDITLINPPLSDDPGNHPIPYGLWQLSSFIKAREYHPEILDLNYIWRSSNATYDELNLHVQNIDSPIVGFTCMGSNLANALEFAEDLKRARPDVIILFGGPHVSLVSKQLLSAFAFVDYVIVGEGEETLAAFLKAFNAHECYKTIPGVLGRNGTFNPRPLMQSLDTLPFLNMELIELEKYISTQSDVGLSFPILAGSGCPFRCSFCSTSVMWERKFRVKSVQRLVDEMKYIFHQTGIKDFDLIHDIFTANKKYLEDFCDTIDGTSFRWLCSSRIDGKIENYFPKMASSGCNGIFYGVESGSQQIQNDIGKRIKVANIPETMQACLSAGIDLVCSTVFGFPSETWEDIDETVQLCLKARAMGAGRSNLHMLLSFPGTEIYRNCEIDKNLEMRDFKRGGLPILTQRAMDWIRHHPDLFSCFFWVKHSSISKNEMYALHNWDKLIATHSETLQSLINVCGNTQSTIRHFDLNSEMNIEPINALQNTVQRLNVEKCKHLFDEESYLLVILNNYRKQKLDGEEPRTEYRKSDHLGRDVVYKIKDEDTIDVYY